MSNTVTAATPDMERGWYEQAMRQMPGTTQEVPTVRFYLDAGRTRWWERLLGFTRKEGVPKDLFGGAKEEGGICVGDGWSPPGQELAEGDLCYMVEGILAAIALHHCGLKTVAVFSCALFPSAFIEAHSKLRIHWVVALDSDKAGKDWAKKHHARLKAMGELASVCILPEEE